jgi:molybdenum cofactor sulfurtransferase
MSSAESIRDHIGEETTMTFDCPEEWYNADIDAIREREYPMLQGMLFYLPGRIGKILMFETGTTYLDHAGTTLYPKSLIEAFSKEMTTNLFGNPHSASSSSQLSTRRIEDTRLRVLRFFNADPEDFDVVFVANATAGIKLVAEAFRDNEKGFQYGYHVDAHTSIVGVRELATKGQKCFASDQEVEDWVAQTSDLCYAAERPPMLFAYPAQSNMTGRRLPMQWCKKLRHNQDPAAPRIYSLLDAASLLSTSPLDLSDAASAPDFTVLSFYKIFGFPDLGALIVRKAAGDILRKRKYFGGGTVDMVVCSEAQWHAKKETSLHACLEDGTPPFHCIVALDTALDTHRDLFDSLDKVSRHTAFLAQNLFDRLSTLRHATGQPVCEIYSGRVSSNRTNSTQGPILALNLKNSNGQWVANSEVEKLAIVKRIQFRTGGLCNPGGIASHLRLAPSEMKSNFAAGQRCGDDNDLINGKPTGAIRISLGAMSSRHDVDSFLDFLNEFYVQTVPEPDLELPCSAPASTNLFVESLAVYPIKSCGAWKVPPGVSWDIHEEGLALDREWCLVHQGTGAALSQKRYPRMTLLRPTIDLERQVLRVRNDIVGSGGKQIEVPLSTNLGDFTSATELCSSLSSRPSRVCGDSITAQVYSASSIATFFTDALNVPCTLARFPPKSSLRHAKAHLQQYQRDAQVRNMPGAYPIPVSIPAPQPILLSNESPILFVSRSSVNRLNEQIKENGGKAVYADVFRANIVVAEDRSTRLQDAQPYIEDTWDQIEIGHGQFQVLGSCRRCQMVCIDQFTADKSEEPFCTLAKTRRFDGKVFFGQHLALKNAIERAEGATAVTIKVGDFVTPYTA